MRRDDDTSRGLLGVCAALALFAGCVPDPGPIATLRGRVSDDEGARALGFGGEGAAAAAARVRVLAVGSRGTLETLNSVEVGAGGSFSLEVPAERARLVVEAVDDGGEVVAAALLEHSGSDGDTVRCTPLDTESSLEAALFLVMATRAEAVEDVNVVDLRARVTARLAAAVREKQRQGEDVSDDVRRLAEALLVAQATEVRGYGAAGVDVTQEELFLLELPASRALSAALHERDDERDAEEAYQAFHEALADVVSGLGLSPAAQARAESSAGLAFRMVVNQRVRVGTIAAREVTESALLAAALTEGRAYEAATLALLASADVDERLRREAEMAARELHASLVTATNTAVAAEAFGALSTTLVGDADASTSLLGGVLGLDATASPAVEAALFESRRATDDLEQVLKRLAQRAQAVPGDIDVRSFSIDVTRAYAAHHDALLRVGDDLASSANDPELALGLVVLAETAYRLRE